MGRFAANGIQHIYQRAADGGVIFYNDFDRLVFYSILQYYARLFGVRLLGVSIMYNHFHLLAEVSQLEKLRSFILCVTSRFAVEYNKNASRSGPLFQHSFGWASKWGDKYVRTAIAYVYNNHSEKKLCSTAMDCRWNFLAYAFSPNPYSERLVVRNSGAQMKKSLRLLKGAHDCLNYAFVKMLYAGLNEVEREQMTDCIISRYNAIDYDKVFGYYDSPHDMLVALNATAGAEHNIEEPADMMDDRPYKKMMADLTDLGYDLMTKDFLLLAPDEKRRLSNTLLKKNPVADFGHVRALLHF